MIRERVVIDTKILTSALMNAEGASYSG